jgi:hypothetical protein
MGKTDNGPAGVQTVGSRMIGNRSYKIRSDERLIGERDGWELSELTAWSRDGWLSLRVLDARTDRPKGNGTPRMRVYQIGYNTAQGRVARNLYWWRLTEHWPEVSAWVLDKIKEDINELS